MSTTTNGSGRKAAPDVLAEAAREAEALRIFRVMGCATPDALAREMPTGEPLSVRRSRAARVLKRHGYERRIGGQKAITYRENNQTYREPAIPATTEWSTKPWETASGSLPKIVRPNINPTGKSDAAQP